MGDVFLMFVVNIENSRRHLGLVISTHYFSKDSIQRESQTKKWTSVRPMES